MNNKHTPLNVMLLVIIGVCGCGKTSVGEALAEKLGFTFADADEFHSVDNKMKMSQGQPLTDQDRLPWLRSIYHHLSSLAKEKRSGIVTCSALKRSYRNILKCGPSPHNFSSDDPSGQRADLDLVFLHLTGSVQTLQKRLIDRKGHMKEKMLESQLAALELLEADEEGFTVDIDMSLDDLVNYVMVHLATKGYISGQI